MRRQTAAKSERGAPRSEAWDLSSLAPPLESIDYDRHLAELQARIEAFGKSASDLPALTGATLAAWVEALLQLEALEAAREDNLGFIDCIKAKDPSDALVQQRSTTARAIWNQFRSARAPLLRHLCEASELAFTALCAAQELAGASLRLRELRREAKLALPEAEERFATDVAMDASRRWAELAAQTIAGTSFRARTPAGEITTYPQSKRFDLLWDGRPEVRRATFGGLTEAFKPQAPLLATCFNAMAGFDLAYAKRRGVDLFEDIMIGHRISPATVQTMQASLREYAPVLHKYLRLKAKLLGLDTIGVYDRSAPLPTPAIDAPDVIAGLDRVIDTFARYSPALADCSRRIYDNQWLDSGANPSKRAGGFCAPFPNARETRVFISYGPSLNAIAVLAHELGHAFHAHANFDQRWWRQNSPASLCETASILCEHMLRDTISLDEAAPTPLRITTLASQLDAAVNYLLRIPRDFDFEATFLAERASGDVSAERLCTIMRDMHAAWFGDVFEGDDGDAYSWTYNHIMMDPRLRFYNFPYSFGYLLSRRIANCFFAQGDAFTPTYVDFLNATGSMSVEDAVRTTLGYDIASKDYWRECLAQVDAQVGQFSALIEGL